MHSSRLFQVLESFTLDEWKGLKKFMRGQPGAGIEVEALYRYLYKHKEDLKSDKLQLDIAHKKVLPDITKKSFQNVMSKMTKIVQNYIRWRWLAAHPVDNDLILLEAYKDRGLYRLFDLKANRVRSDIEQIEEADIWDDLASLKVNHMQFFSNNPIKGTKGRELLQNATRDLSSLATNASLYYQITMSHFGRIINFEFSNASTKIESLVQDVESRQITDTLKGLYKVTKEASKNDFEHLTHEITRNNLKLDRDLLSASISILIKYSDSRFSQGKHETAQQLFELYEFGIKSKLLLVNNKIPFATFLNIINTACSANHLLIAKEMIEKYSGLLDQHEKDEAIALSKAHIAFKKEKYGEVITLIRDLQCNKFGSKIRMRWLLLCSYFMEYRLDTDFLNSVFRNYELFFKNNKNRIRVTTVLGSINLSKVLKSQLNESSKQKLEEDLNFYQELIFRTFLRDLANRL